MKLLHRISLYGNPCSLYKNRKIDELTSNWTRMAASCLYSGHNANIAYHVITGSDISLFCVQSSIHRTTIYSAIPMDECGLLQSLMLILDCPLGYSFFEEGCIKCPESYIRFKNKCYKYSSTHVSWYDARGICTEEGGDLVSLNGPAFFDHVEKFVMDKGMLSFSTII